jgi:hypothetical protein
MEGFCYAAIVEANLESIAEEAEQQFGAKIDRSSPIVQILAPMAWWRGWFEFLPAGGWGAESARLANAVESRTGVNIECMALDDSQVTYGRKDRAPRLDRVPAIYPVRPDDTNPIGNPLQSPVLHRDAVTNYSNMVHQSLWSWAEKNLESRLDGGRRQKRVPVLKPEFAVINLLLPPGISRADEIRSAIAPVQRHRFFASLRSSQALAQSVFGAIKAFNRLDLLENITAECGRPAFLKDHRGCTLEFEHDVKTLGEPRPTSIDVLFSDPDRRVAIEFKFTGPEFGTCSDRGCGPIMPATLLNVATAAIGLRRTGSNDVR